MVENNKIIRHQHELDEVVRRQIASVLRRAPKRMFDTATGILYSNTTQTKQLPSLSGAFKSSAAYQSLSGSLQSRAISYSDAANAVSGFYRYAMLSHRWGKGEPLLHQITGNAYALKQPAGVAKLQWFLRTAAQHKIGWAWSDTCCIDKSNSRDVQQSITTMFAWYRDSTLTIVYLADVFKSSYDAISRSEWFTRGWTLQELLAPLTIHFYKADGQPFYPDYRNFRKDSQMIHAISNITTIHPQYLTRFEPGMDNARDKLKWMSFRETTVEADKAYCLLGIFGVVIPEAHDANSKWQAYAKLIKEVLRKGGKSYPNSGVTDEDIQSVYGWLRHHTQRAKQDAGHLQQFVQSTQAPKSQYLFS